MRGRAAQLVKRCIDVAAASAGIATVWPVLVVIGAAVKLESDGPIIYRGKRAGVGGKPFYILKFRTMVQDAEKVGGTTTGKDDPRITSVGGFLRRYKLDELPQLFNVLRGDMSLVGPRPEVYEYVDAYTAEEMRILDVRPGITDLASIEFVDLQSHVGGDDPDRTYREHVLARKNALRLEYVDRQSLALDGLILFRTAVAVLPKRRRE